jgi:hypothetical protein
MNRIKFVIFLTIFLSFLKIPAVFSQNDCPTATNSIYSDTVNVLHYGIHLEEINLTTQTIKGYTEIRLTPLINGLSEIKLELVQLIVDSVFVNNVLTGFSHQGTDLKMFLQDPVNVADTLIINVYYHGTPFVDPSDWGGFHFAGEYAFNLGVGFDAIPHNLGKAWFPCVDDFRDRALYDVYVTVTNDKKAISGGYLYEVNDIGNGSSIWHWKTIYSLPTYLISVTTGPYALITDSYNGISGQVPITFYCRPADSSKVAGTFVHLKDILRIYEEHFGPYPFERVGYSGTAIGAMEHAANIFYPYSGWDGGTTNEWWYAHELSHMWFGDMVTCASAEDMWLNEGWAVWCESLFQEFLYGKDLAKDYLRAKLRNVIQTTHSIDGGYYPVYGIPQTITYGNTVYEKGAQVTHTLRNYLGDSLFFNGIKAYLQHFAFQPASSCEMRDFLSSWTGIDLNDFFNAWVFSPGFLNFSVGYMQYAPATQGYDATVYVNQKLKEMPAYANSNHLEITFLGKDWQQFTDTIIFSGKQGHKTFRVPFEPVEAIADLNEKISDAAIDHIAIVKNAGDLDFTGTFARVVTTQVPDSAYVRVTHNWVAPDSLKVPVPGLRISDSHYWKVQGIFPTGYKAQGKFYYNRSTLDKNLLNGAYDSLVILYRPDSRSDWKGIRFTRLGNSTVGLVLTDSLRRGEYALAAWDRTFGIMDPVKNSMDDHLKIFPNPAHGNCTIQVDIHGSAVLRIFDSMGKKLEEFPFRAGKHEMNWCKGNTNAGVYYFRLYSGFGDELANEKMIFN